MVIKKEIIINTSTEKAWDVLGPQFSNPSLWASAVQHSEGKGNSFQGATCSERGCSTSIGKIREKLTHYSDSTHSLSYEVTDGMPSFVKTATNTWQLTKIESDKTLLQTHAVINLSGFLGKIMKPFIKLQMSGFAQEALEDFKYFAEKGVPHPRKIKAIKKTKA